MVLLVCCHYGVLWWKFKKNSESCEIAQSIWCWHWYSLRYEWNAESYKTNGRTPTNQVQKRLAWQQITFLHEWTWEAGREPEYNSSASLWLLWWSCHTFTISLRSFIPPQNSTSWIILWASGAYTNRDINISCTVIKIRPSVCDWASAGGHMLVGSSSSIAAVLPLLHLPWAWEPAPSSHVTQLCLFWLKGAHLPVSSSCSPRLPCSPLMLCTFLLPMLQISIPDLGSTCRCLCIPPHQVLPKSWTESKEHSNWAWMLKRQWYSSDQGSLSILYMGEEREFVVWMQEKERNAFQLVSPNWNRKQVGI